MTDLIGPAATVGATVGAGLAGGVYFAFAAVVLPALRRGSAPEAITVMKRLNDTALRAPFMVVFFGGALAACAAAATAVLGEAGTETAVLRIVGAGLAVASFVTTVVFNVPRNVVLSRVNPSDTNAVDSWRSFDPGWSRANAVRAVFSAGGAALLALSLHPGIWVG